MFEPSRVLSSLAFCVAIVSSVHLAKEAFIRIKTSDKTMHVPGAAKKRVQSDLAIWPCRLTVRTADAQMVGGYQALEGVVKKLIPLLEQRGLRRSEMEVSAVKVEEVFRRDANGRTTDVLSGYQMMQWLTVRSKDLKRVGNLAQSTAEIVSATGMAQQGIILDAGTPQYRFFRLEELKLTVLAEATRNARIRAKEIATSSGTALRTLLSAQLGDIRITSTESGSTNRYGDDESSLEKDIAADVTLVYRID